MEGKKHEKEALIKSRQIAQNLELDMKISDVEYQGDNKKAIFYFISEGRIDFRELVKELAKDLCIKIEMKQIGARQEAGRIGGIGPCGREICCASWISNFISVNTNSARYQDISLNPQKLAGQCGKLKCCLNFEVDTYIDAQKDFPTGNIPLETENGVYQYQKADIFKQIFWYSQIGDKSGAFFPVPVKRVKEILQSNKNGKKVERLIQDIDIKPVVEKLDFEAGSDRDTLTRFDDPKQAGNKKRNNRRRKFRPKQ